MPRGGKVIFDTSFLLCIVLKLLLYSVVGSGIPLGSKLSVEENNYWVSSNGDFAIGFFTSSNQYSIGIRFFSSSIPESKQRVVWVAGGELRVGSSSYFQLNNMGEFVLYDSATKEFAWTSKTGNASVASAVLQDDGNLVLLNNGKDIVWQSFDTPSDTLLPGQNLSVLQVLRPPSKNSVSSYYSLFMDQSGQLKLRWETSVIYWTSGKSSESALRAMLRADGTLQLLDQRSKPIWSVVGEDHNGLDAKFRFLRLDLDGNLRLYSWQDALKSWRSVWQAFENQCDVFATCNLRGVCQFNSSGSPFCKCPFTYPGESNAKCLIPYQESCRSGSSMITYDHTSLYGIYPPNETIVQISLRQCKILCQEDPLCTAATFVNNGSANCRIIRTRYIGGQSSPSLGYVSFAKTCLDPIAVPIQKPTQPSSVNSSPKSSKEICFLCLTGVAAGTVIVFVMIQFGVILYILRRKKDTRKRAAFTNVDRDTRGCIMLSYPEIGDLTDNFKNQIGPQVFKGILPDNRPVAVKKLSTTVDERKFRTAVSRIGSIYHKNLLKLECFCSDSGHRFLVYEFTKNGSLGNCLDDPKMSKKLTWKRRFGIGLGTARAIFYLHTECREFVSHGNLKGENVLLDENLEAKASEYGLMQFITEETSNAGGMAEADVRDFGKMLVRLITGCQYTDEACKQAYQMWAADQTESIADNRMEGGANPDELERALRIAFWCLQGDERMRPSMGEVVKVLEGTLPVDTPPPLFSHCLLSPSLNEQQEPNEEP